MAFIKRVVRARKPNRATAVLPEELRNSIGCLRAHCRLLSARNFLLSCTPVSPACRRRAPATTTGSHAHMIGLIPEADDWTGQLVFIPHGTQAGRAQHEPPGVGRHVKLNPARRQYPNEMPAGKQQHVPLHGTQATHDTIGPRRGLGWRFPSWAAVAEQFPVGALRPDLGGAASLILAVVPFDQLTIHFSHGPEAGQRAGPGGALQGTGIDLGERQAAQPCPELAGVALAALSQWQVGQSRVLAREAPGRLAVPGQINDRQLFTHDLATPTTVSGCALPPGRSLLAANEDSGLLALAIPAQPRERHTPARPRSHAGVW